MSLNWPAIIQGILHLESRDGIASRTYAQLYRHTVYNEASSTGQQHPDEIPGASALLPSEEFQLLIPGHAPHLQQNRRVTTGF